MNVKILNLWQPWASDLPSITAFVTRGEVDSDQINLCMDETVLAMTTLLEGGARIVS